MHLHMHTHIHLPMHMHTLSMPMHKLKNDEAHSKYKKFRDLTAK